MRRVLLLLALVAGCAASSRETALKTAYVTLHATDAAWTEYDEVHQDAIVASATSLEDGRTKLAAYRKSRAKAVAALTVAAKAVEAAIVLNDDQSIASLKVAIANAVAAVAVVKASAP